MKKVYLAPVTDSYQIELASMIALSNKFNAEDPVQDIQLTEDEVDKFQSRNRNVWGDEEDF